MTPAITRTLFVLSALFAAWPAAGQFEFQPGGGFDFGSKAGFDAFGAAPEPDELVQVSAEFAPATDTLPAMVAVTAVVADGYHIYSLTQPAGGPQAASLRLDETSGKLLGEWVADPAPDVHVDEEIWVGLQMEEHHGEVTWRAPIELPRGADPATHKVSGVLNGQACTATSCLSIDGTAFVAKSVAAGSIPGPRKAAPRVIENRPAPSTDAAKPAANPERLNPAAAGDKSFAAVLAAAFAGGLILNLMPCVLPVIGLKVLSFAEQAGHDRGKVLAMNVAYSAGLVGVFMLLATLAAFAGYGWGELYTHAEFKIGMVILVFAMALSFLGVWEIPLPGFAGGKAANDLQLQEGYSGAFFKGVFTTVLATPCSGPFLGPVFGYTLAQPPWVTYAIFGSVGLGMAFPYLLIGVFPSLVNQLPKPGAWMETFKQLMGFVLMGTVVYLFSLVGEEHRLPVLTTLVAVAFACWWVGSTPITASATKRMAAWLGGAGAAVAVGFAAFMLMKPSDHELPWQEFTPARLAAAQQDGQTVLVDFTADWCPTCHLNSRVAINTELVKRVVEANGVTPMLADWSDKNDMIEETLASLGSRSIPFLAIFPAGRPDQPILLPDLITESQLLEALADAGAIKENAEAADVPEIEIGEAAGVSGAYR